MPILLDGNNLLNRLPKASRTRADVRRLVLDSTRHEKTTVVVVFDGPPPRDALPEESLGKVTVLYSAPKSADDVIISRLPAGPSARNWVVITDDRELARKARDRGAPVRPIGEWQSKRPQRSRRQRAESKLSSHEVEAWERFFADDREDNA
jgi:hypothetical protein